LKVIQCGGAQRGSGPQIETRVMPGAAHGITDEKAFTERPAVVRAIRGDGKNLVTLPRNQHCLAGRVANDHRPVGEITFGYSIAEIGPGQLAVFHGTNDTLAAKSPVTFLLFDALMNRRSLALQLPFHVLRIHEAFAANPGDELWKWKP
jgi:hypothetical protein